MNSILKNLPLVSVIVPVYNVGEYLNPCIESIIDQSYKNIEIILVDDGSTDGSEDICDNYLQNDSRIVVIHKKNGGVSSARNAGLAKIHGEFVTFVDADDKLGKNFIKNFTKIFINDMSIDIIMGRYTAVDNGIEKSILKRHHNCVMSPHEGLQAIIEHIYASWILCGKMYKSKLFENFICNEGLRLAEDFDDTWNLFQRAKKIFYSDTADYYYIMRENSASHTPEYPELKKHFENFCKKMHSTIALQNYNLLNAMRVNFLEDYYCNELKKPFYSQRELEENMYCRFTNFQKDLIESISALQENEIKNFLYLQLKTDFHNFLFIQRKILEDLKNCSKLYIYGAGKYSEYIRCYFKQHNINFIAFIISDGQQNIRSLDDIHPVVYLKDISYQIEEIGVFMAMNLRNMITVFPNLKRKGIKNIWFW